VRIQWLPQMACAAATGAAIRRLTSRRSRIGTLREPILQRHAPRHHRSAGRAADRSAS
jgi:hypothetical protein